jgi:hypothetical protein
MDLIPIADQVTRGLILRECLRDLACDPIRGWMRCDIDPDEVSAGQPNDYEGIRHRASRSPWSGQRTGPWRRWLRRNVRQPWDGGPHSFTMYFANARLTDLKAEFEQLAIDAQRSPQGIFHAQTPDERAQFRIDLRSIQECGISTAITDGSRARCQRTRVSGGMIVDSLEDRWKPSIQHDQEQAIPIRDLDYTFPMVREDLFAMAKDKQPQRKRNPIGSVHFGEPEEEPRSYLDEYIQLILDGDRDDVDELLVGFTAPIDPPF